MRWRSHVVCLQVYSFWSALRSSDVKNMSSLRALNSSPTLWLMSKATAVPLLTGLKLEVILDWGLRHWHSAPAPALALMFPYHFMNQTGRRVSREGRKARSETRRHKLCMHTCTHPCHLSGGHMSQPCPVPDLLLQKLTSKCRFRY